MADHLEASVTLPSDPASVSAARSYVVTTLAEWGLPSDTDTADTIRLIVSELTTNAVQHTLGQSPTFTVDLELDRDEQLRGEAQHLHPLVVQAQFPGDHHGGVPDALAVAA
ncbi:ATP-binding protein, partial [Streptomyces nigra]